MLSAGDSSDFGPARQTLAEPSKFQQERKLSVYWRIYVEYHQQLHVAAVYIDPGGSCGDPDMGRLQPARKPSAETMCLLC
jgi:hypothetical protein